MKFPNHILLDVSKHSISYSNQYWIFIYLTLFKKNIDIFQNLNFHKKFYLNKENYIFNKLIKEQKKFTIKYNYTNAAVFLSEEEKKYYENAFEVRLKVKHRLLYSKHWGKEIFDYLKNPDLLYNEKNLKRLIKNFKFQKKTNVFKTNNLWSLFDINFLKKERIYTKLKYSRVPQYDMVSGGAAVLFAGFLGFLITEKFGFELADSGDFYYLFMYLVFACFACRIYFKMMTIESSTWAVLSFKWLIVFIQILLKLCINFFKLIIKK